MKTAIRMTVAAILMLIHCGPASASEFGCKVMLCLASPGGAKQYAECHPTIEKLQQKLSRGEPFPSCKEANSEGVATKKGYEPYEPCSDGYEQASMVSTEFGRRETTVCRKLTGFQEETLDGQTQKVPVYEYYDATPRAKARYIEVWVNGEQSGERYYY